MTKETEPPKLSNCCYALPLYDESDLCSKCKEHAEFLTEEEMEKEDERSSNAN